MARRFKFFLMGLIPGLILVLFSCSYFPNDRVIAETLSKPFAYSADFRARMQTENISEEQLKDEIVAKGKIDFDKSEARREPCPRYLLRYPAQSPQYEIFFEKCKEQAKFESLRRL